MKDFVMSRDDDPELNTNLRLKSAKSCQVLSSELIVHRRLSLLSSFYFMAVKLMSPHRHLVFCPGSFSQTMQCKVVQYPSFLDCSSETLQWCVIHV